MHYTESKSFVADDGDPVVDVVFTCRHVAGEPCALDPAEVAAHPDAPPRTRRSIQLAEQLRLRLDPRA